jgi:hypothetical protein
MYFACAGRHPVVLTRLYLPVLPDVPLEPLSGILEPEDVPAPLPLEPLDGAAPDVSGLLILPPDVPLLPEGLVLLGDEPVVAPDDDESPAEPAPLLP